MRPDVLTVVMAGAHLNAHGGVAAVERLIVANRPSGVQIHHLPTMADGSTLHKASIFARALVESRRLGNRLKPDLFYLHVAVKGSVFRKCLLALVALPSGQPYVLHAHGGDFNDWFARRSSVVQALVRTLFRRASCVIALSDSWAQYYRETFGLPSHAVVVIPNPVECPATPPVRGMRSPVRFLFLGSMDDRKGAFRAALAFAKLPEALRNASTLTIAGNGRVEDLRALVRSLDLGSRILVQDWLDHAQRDEALRESDVYVLPSLNEGLPMGMLEAMSWGLAVIVTPVGGIPEVVIDGQNGLLVAPQDEPALVAAMQRLVLDAPLRARLAEAARSTAMKFDAGAYWIALEPALRSALRSAPISVRSGAHVSHD